MTLVAVAPPPVAWLRLVPGVLVIAVLLLLFRDTAAAMVDIWTRSETFAHAFLVPPIVLWLVWRRRAELARVQTRPQPWLLLPLALVCLLWLLGELASVNAATQFALVALIVLSVPAVFGLAVARELTFPLAFLFFAVPIGEFMVPQMMEWTADFTVLALQWTGIPVYREGLQFVIPSGNWSVVEACSGVRYLIASFMVGSLFAYLNYRTWQRRLMFVAVAIILPILANWVRAYIIVMLGHLSGNTIAAGADHLIYGWVWFGIVIGIMFMVGARFSEPDLPAQASAPQQAGATRMPSSSPGRAWVVAVAVVALLAGTQAMMWRLGQPGDRPGPTLALPDSLDGGWSAPDAPAVRWAPAYPNPSASIARSYRRNGAEVGVWIGYYRDQSYERKLVTSTNLLVVEPGPWALVSQAGGSVAGAAGPQRVRTAVLREPSDPKAPEITRLHVAYLYWVGGRYSASDAETKLRLALNRLLGRGDDSAVVFFHTPRNATAGEADALLQDFAGRQLPRLDALLSAARNAAP